jgi:hypothetical protein
MITAEQWKDDSEYSRGDKNGEPRHWTLQLPFIIITVHRHIHYEPDKWLMSCVQLGFNKRELFAKDSVHAREEALDICRDLCREYMKALEI